MIDFGKLSERVWRMSWSGEPLTIEESNDVIHALNLIRELSFECELRGLPLSATALARHERGAGLFIGAAQEHVRMMEKFGK